MGSSRIRIGLWQVRAWVTLAAAVSETPCVTCGRLAIEHDEGDHSLVLPPIVPALPPIVPALYRYFSAMDRTTNRTAEDELLALRAAFGQAR